MPQVDIIIRSKDGRDMLHELIDSIHSNTPDYLYRLIVVDDGSKENLLDGAGEIDFYVRSKESKGAVTATNMGLVVALKQPDSPYVLIMDNDTKIPDGDDTWLQRMIAELEQGGEETACVGATSAFVNQPQMVLGAPETYVGDENPPVPWFVSFTVLFRKSVLQELGQWDQRYNPGNYEDTDYAMAVRCAGYKIKVARSVYIHHVGHQTFGDDMQELLATNQARFHQKWGYGRLWDMGFIHPVHMAPILKQSLEEVGNSGISA